MYEFNGDYEGTAAQKLHFDSFDKKRSPEFVGEIQAMIDNNLNSITRNLGVSEFLIRLRHLDVRGLIFYHVS